MSKDRLDTMVKIIAFVFPTLIVVCGFFMYSAGYSFEMATGYEGMKKIGLILIAIGIVAYLVELVLIIYNKYR